MRVWITGVILLLIIPTLVPAQDQDPGKIAQALADRLTCSHLLVTIVEHEPITLRIEEQKKRATMMWKGNKVFAMRTRTLDTETEMLSIGENIVEMSGNGWNKLYLNKAGRSLYLWNHKENRSLHLAKVSLHKRPDCLEVTMLEHEPIRMDICLKHGVGVVYFGGGIPFRISMKYKKIRGAAKDNLLRINGNGSREFFLNRSRKIIFFENPFPAMDGRFADVEIENSTGSSGHPNWKFNADP